MEKVLEVKDLCKKYTGFELKNVNLSIPKGMIIGLIGENGAGKTTTIKAILNIINKDKGQVKVFGLDLQQNEKKIKQDIGVVLDDSFLSEYLTPKDISKIMKNFYPTWDEKLYLKYLEKFNLPINKIYKEFSSGMIMKLKIATAISHKPKFLILDEPTAGLDPVARNDILDIFQEFIEDGEHSILLSSHITSDLEHIADYIIFIKNKEDFKRKYNISVIDKPTIEDIMLIYIKGEK